MIHFNEIRGRRPKMKGNDTEANRRGEQKGGQKDGMKSEPSWVIFIFMPLCEMRNSFSALVLASYLAMHEFKVDSFQCNLEQSTFTSFHVLDRKLSAQFRTCRKPNQSLDLVHMIKPQNPSILKNNIVTKITNCWNMASVNFENIWVTVK